MNRSRLAVVIAAAALLLTSCAGARGEPVTPEPSGGLSPMVLGSPIEGFSLNGAATFPAAGEQPEAYSFTLYQMPGSGGMDLGVFRVTSQASGQATPRAVHVGPAGLEGFFVDGVNEDLVLASRRMSSKDLRTLANKTPEGLAAELAASETIVGQPVATVPGIGSLPMATQLPGYAVSYTKDQTDEATQDQVSIVIGTYQGASSELKVLDWWFGSHEVKGSDHHVYTFATLNSADDEAVPMASLDVSVAGGIVTMIRTTGLSDHEMALAFQNVRPATPAEWADILSNAKG